MSAKRTKNGFIKDPTKNTCEYCNPKDLTPKELAREFRYLIAMDSYTNYHKDFRYFNKGDVFNVASESFRVLVSTANENGDTINFFQYLRELNI